MMDQMRRALAEFEAFFGEVLKVFCFTATTTVKRQGRAI